MADLKILCIDGDCSNVPSGGETYTAGDGISIEDGVISNTAMGVEYTAGDNITISNENVISADDPDLSNYYNKTEVNDLISGLEGIRMEVVDALPATGESNVIYLLDDGQGNYDQWVYTESDGWINLGSEEIDLSNYYTKTEADTLLNGKQDKLTAGTRIAISGNTISTTAEVNQNAFSNVKVGSTTVAADTKTDTLELVAGSNITLTPDATNDKITIAATNTTYTATAPIAISGTTISHNDSGVTAGTKGTNNTTALTPAFGATFNVIGMAVNAKGHVTSANSHTVKMPNSAASTSAAGLMSAADKTKLNGLKTINNLTTSSYTDGQALSAYQGYLLNQKIDKILTALGGSNARVTVVRKYSYTVPKAKFFNYVGSGADMSASGAGLVRQWFATGTDIKVSIPVATMDTIDIVVAQTKVVSDKECMEGVNVQTYKKNGNYLDVVFDAYELTWNDDAPAAYALPVEFLVIGQKAL